MMTRLMLNLRDPNLMATPRSSARTGTNFYTSQNLSTLVDPENDTTFTQDHGRLEHNTSEGDIELAFLARSHPDTRSHAPTTS